MVTSIANVMAPYAKDYPENVIVLAAMIVVVSYCIWAFIDNNKNGKH